MIGKTPATVDVYLRLIIPKDKKMYDNVFRMITPTAKTEWLSSISANDIYAKLAQSDVRNAIRSVLQQTDSIEQITTNMDKYSGLITAKVIDHFTNAAVPLNVINVQISNVKLDDAVNSAQNELAAMKSKITTLRDQAEIYSKNPNLMEIEKAKIYLEIAKTGKVQNFTIISGDNSPVLTR